MGLLNELSIWSNLGEFDILVLVLSTSGFGNFVPIIPSDVEEAEGGWVERRISEILFSHLSILNISKEALSVNLYILC